MPRCLINKRSTKFSENLFSDQRYNHEAVRTVASICRATHLYTVYKEKVRMKKKKRKNSYDGVNVFPK